MGRNARLRKQRKTPGFDTCELPLSVVQFLEQDENNELPFMLELHNPNLYCIPAVKQKVMRMKSVAIYHPWADWVMQRMGVSLDNAFVVNFKSEDRAPSEMYRARYSIDEEMDAFIASGCLKFALPVPQNHALVAFWEDADRFSFLHVPHSEILESTKNEMLGEKLPKMIESLTPGAFVFLYIGADKESGAVILETSRDYDFLIASSNPAVMAMIQASPLYDLI